MKTPNPDVDPFVEALRGDLPCAADEARVRARLLAAGVVVTGAALSSSSAGAPLAGSSLGASSLGASSLGASSLGAGSGAAAAGTIASGAAASGAAGGSLAGAPALLVKAGVLSKVLVLPVAAKVGVAATLAMAVAATSVPLVLERPDAANDARVARAEQSASSGERRTTAPATGNPSGSAEAALGPASRADANAGASEAAAAEAAATQAAATQPAATPAAATPAAASGAGRAAELARQSEARSLASGRPAPPLGTRSAPAAARTGLVPAASPSAASPSAAAQSAAVQSAAAPRAPVRADSTEASGAQPSGAPTSAALAGSTAASAGGRTELVVASSLAEEARLIEQAMLALSGGQHELARRSLEEHARRFPAGLLGRERERALARLRRANAENDAENHPENDANGSSR